MAWYKNGQVTVQSGSRSVLGVGTAWLGQVLPGEGLDVLDGRLQEIAEVISNTELLLVDAYAGAAAVDVAYQIIPSASMTKELTRRVNVLVGTHEQMTAGVEQAYASTLEKAAQVVTAAQHVEVSTQAAAQAAHSAGTSQAAAHADSDAAMGYRNEARAARDAASAEAAGAAQHKAAAQAAALRAEQSAASIDPIESVKIDATSLQDFFAQCLAKGSGFYRADGDSIPIEMRYSPGLFSKTQDTWSFIANRWDTARPVFFSGRFEDIPASTWKQYDPMARGNHTGEQSISTVAGLQGALNSLIASDSQMSTQLAGVSAVASAANERSLALALAVGFAIVYPNGGSAAAPGSVATNTRYVSPSPFPGRYFICVVQVLYGGIWADPGWDGNSGTGSAAYGVRAGMANSDLVVQTGSTALLVTSALSGGLHGLAPGASVGTPLPCRVLCWVVGGAM